MMRKTCPFSGANTYTGATTVSAGTLKLGNANVIPDASAVTIGGATTAGNLDINGFSDTHGPLTLGSNSTTVGGLQNNVVNNGGGSPVLAVAGALVYNAGAVGFNNGKALISANLDLAGANRTWTINDSAATAVDLEVSGIISGTGSSSISKLGTGTLLLSNDATLGNGLSIAAGGNLDLTGATLGVNSTNILSLTGGSLTLNNLTFQDLVGWDWANAAAGTYELIDAASRSIGEAPHTSTRKRPMTSTA